MWTEARRNFMVKEQRTCEGHILFLSGELDLASSFQLKSAIKPLLRDSLKTLTLDLKNLSYMDSTGVGLIISILKMRQSLSGPFSVKEIPPNIEKLFRLTGIDAYIQAANHDFERHARTMLPSR